MFDALQSDNLDTIVAFLNHLDHFLASFHFFPSVGHGGGNFIGFKVSESFLHVFEVDFEPSARVSVDGHGVED